MVRPNSQKELDFQLLFESMPGAYLVLSPDFKIVAASNEYLKICSRSREEVVGGDLFETFPDNPQDPHADGTKNLRISLERVLKNKLPDVMPLQKYDIQKKDHSRHEHELNQSRTFLNSLIENLPLMIFVKEAKQLRFVKLNKAGEQILGLSKNELIGKNDYDFFPKEQADYFVKIDRAVLSGKAILDIPEEPIENREKGTIWLHTKKIPLFDENGHPEYLLGISEDITEKKRADEERIRMIREEAVYRERERVAKGASFLAEASRVLASTLEYKESLHNLGRLIVPELSDWCAISIQKEDQAFERVLAIHRDPEKAPLLEKLKRINPLGTSLDAGVADGGLAHVMKTGETHLFSGITPEELRGESVSEEHFSLLEQIGVQNYLMVPIRAHDRIMGSIAFFNGEREREFSPEDRYFAEELGRRVGMTMDNAFLYEKARLAIEARDEFLSIASHELKTPITSLKMQIQMAERSVKPEINPILNPQKLAKVFEISNSQVNRLTRLIEDLLDVSRIQAGKISFDLEKINFSDLIQDVLERYTESSDAASCTLVKNIEEQVTGIADRTRVEQVLVNLLSNAFKYAAGTKIKVALQRRGENIQITVQDSGPGIAPEKQARIFERFERASSSRNISGLGLGLFITKEIVEAHHGSIALKSELGKGSTFIVSIPAKPHQ